MTNRPSTANLVARSAAFARSMAVCVPPPRLLPFRQGEGGTMSAARLAPLTLLAALAVAAALFAIYVYPAHAQDGSAPDKPRGLEATATHNSITLTWNDPNDDSITGYVILRRVRINDQGGDFSVLVADTSTAALTYTDGTVAASTTYTYRIKAINQYGASERSRWYHIDTPAAPERRSAYVDAHNAGVHELAEFPADSDPLSPDGAASEEDDDASGEDPNVGKQGKSVGTQQGRSSHTVDICNRTPEVRDALLESIGDGATCSAVTVEQLAGVRELIVNGYGSASIVPTDFAGLTFTGRGWLILSDNRINSLPPGSFNDVTGVKRLNLTDNHITGHYVSGLADGLAELEELYLIRNHIKVLPAGSFEGLATLTTLRLQRNGLTILEANSFSGLTTLRNLDLTGNALQELPAGIFSALGNLQNLYLEANGLTTLRNDVFEGRTSLARLELHDNRLTELNKDMFDGLSDLEILYLQDNLLTELDADIFDGLSSLRYLRMGDNSFSELDEDIFDGLGALFLLDMNGNNLTELDEDIFEDLGELNTLNLYDNNLTSLPSDIFEPPDCLKELALSENNFGTLPADVFDDLGNLQGLYLYDNDLSGLDEEVFDGLPFLRRLYLYDNELTTLPADIFDGLSSLTHLYLDENQLTALPANLFEGLDESLDHLYLRDNSLTALPSGVFDGLTGLRRLDLSCNALTALNLDLFDPFAGRLRYLDLDANPFDTPPTEAAVNAKLTVLDALYLNGPDPCWPAYDAGLSELSLSTGALSPAFAPPGISEYSTVVGLDSSALTITATPRSPNAFIWRPSTIIPGRYVYDNDPDTSGIQVVPEDLSTLVNDIRASVGWRVIAENLAHFRSYSVKVFREQLPGSVARLSSLALSDLTLSPEFGSATYDYGVEETTSATQTIVTAIPLDPDASVEIRINDEEDADGTVDLVAGYNVITVVVTAEDGTTTQSYTVTVLRAQPDDDDDSTDDTITSLLARLDAELRETVQHTSTYTSHAAGYDVPESKGTLSPAGFNYPAGFGPWYRVEELVSSQEGAQGSVVSTGLHLNIHGTVTSVASSGNHRAHVLPAVADITLRLEGDNWTRSYSLDDATRVVDQCSNKDSTMRHCRMGETTIEEYNWNTDLPPVLAGGDKVIVRLRYSAPRPGTPGRPLMTAPEGKSGALVVKWIAPANDDPKVRGYEVHVSPAHSSSGGVTRTTGGSTLRLPVLLLEPDTAYDVRVRARTYFASGPWSETVRAKTNPLQGTNSVSVELDLNDVTKVKVGDKLYKRLKVTGMNNLHAGAFDAYLGIRKNNLDVEFRVLGGIHDSYVYEDLTRGYGEGAFYAGALTIGEDGEVYHNFGYEVIATGAINEDGVPEYGPLYLWLERTTGGVQIGSTANSRATALCVEIADDSNAVPTGRTCSTNGSAGHAVDRLTGRFVNVPQSHDGESEFTVRLAFVEDVGISPTSLREDALAATGGAVTQVQRVDDRSDLFEITVEPDSDEDVTITLSSSGDCGESGAICTQGEDPRKLYNSPTATVAGPILTASFQGLPSQHDGETAFSFRIAFSDEIATDAAEFRDHSVEVWGGEVTRAEPVGQRRDLWEVEVAPASEDMVMVSLKLTQSCAATGAVCTAGGRLLSVVPATMVPGPATWPVRVTGEARVGKTLTADSSNLSERYGVQVTSMTYRWLADGARIPGAIARTYQPDDDKQGKRISVMATYTDDRGNEETVISAPTEPLAARDRIRRATGLPLISGRALVGHTLTADTSLIIDPNGLENAVFYYFWEADDDSIPDATDSTYTPVEADVGKEITFIVAWVDDAGHGQNMTSQPTMPVMTAEAAAAVEFRKSLRVAANADGSVTLYWNAPDEDVTGYRILRHRHSLGELDPLVYVADTGSTATAYTDTGMVAGVPHNYRVQAIRDGVLGERTNQIKIFPVRKAANSPATGAPAISGTAQVGETLTADISGIADEDGLENVTKDYLWAAIGSSGIIGSKYTYQWLADGADSGSGDHHAGYNNTTYTLTEDDVGNAMSVRVTFVDDAGYQETLASAATDPVAALPQPNSPATGAPAITGTAQVGETLTVDTSGITDEDGLDDSTFTHQWVREDSVMVASAARSYTPTGGDRGKSVKVRVSFTDDAGNRETRTSTQTAPIEGQANGQEGNSPATGLPTISGAAQVGETLTADITRIADADGLSGETFTYQWISGDGTTGTDIENATGSTYTLVAADQGRSVKVRVTFTDGGGNEETLTSAPTGPVWGDGPPGAPRNLAATAGNKEVTLSWDPPADNGNAPATGYRIEWRADGKDYDKNIWGTAGSTTYTTNDQANLANGVKYFFRVRAGNGSGYSYGPYGPASDEVSATPTSGSAVDLGTPVLSDTENLHHGMVQLDWQDVEDAGWYVIQHYYVEGGEWVNLPAEGVDIAFHGSSAVVSNLHGLSWLRVRAMSCAGESEWSQIEQLFGTKASDWEGVPVPEVAEGDEIEPCPVVLSTPVLAKPETLHHGMVRLDWENIEDAGWYVVQYYHIDGGSGEWLDLPAEGVDIAFHGSSAVLSNLHGLSWLRIRAMSCAGESEWSQIEQLFGTKASDWEGVPVPEVEEGDEIEPCSEDPDTPDNSPATGAPTISGTAQVGEILTANTSGVADADGRTNATFSYQWLADDADINGATGSTYTLTDSDEGKAIKVEVSFTDDADNEETLTSAATDAVAAAPTPNSPATGAPTISGTAQVGETLTADTSGVSDADGLSSVQYEYQWLADDSEIAGATSSTYTLVDVDEGKAISVSVSFTDDAGNQESLTSAATDAVAAAGPAEPPAKPRGLEATATHDSVTLTWDDPGDDSITGYVILRRVRVNNEGGEFSELVADTGTAAATYTDNTVAASTTYTYRIKAINGAGTSERSRWFHIDIPAAPVPDKPTGLSATATHDSVTLTWNDPGDDSITGYVILRRLPGVDAEGHFDELVADTGTAATTYTDSSVEAETRYTYRIKAINEHGTSERSRWYHIDTPAAP